MVDLAEVQTAYYLVAATGVLVAAFYYVYNMSATRKTQELALKAQELSLKSQEQTLTTRQAQLFMNIYQNTMSSEFLDSGIKSYTLELRELKDFQEMEADPEKYKAFYIMANWLEGIGVLVREGLVDIHLVSILESGFIVWWWDHFREGIIKVRVERNFPRYMIETEYLAKRVVEYGKEHPELGISLLSF
ncbi:MAG: hypothetical protein ABSA11_17265 [Candidatus Bathyarchaeia archaeon]|jgi:hypothetical protein